MHNLYKPQSTTNKLRPQRKTFTCFLNGRISVTISAGTNLFKTPIKKNICFLKKNAFDVLLFYPIRCSNC